MAETITLPALIDPHVHFREPGNNKAETIASGSLAALIGGYALVADMPNNPGRPTWDVPRLIEKHEIARRDAYIPMAFNAGSQPEDDNISELANMMHLAIALKGYGGKTTGIDRATDYEGPEFEPIIKEYAQVGQGKPYLWHSGEDNLPYMIDLVAKRYGIHLHVCHVNDPAQVALVVRARNDDLPVSCGVCPHHILKTSHDRITQGKFAEMQPPLADQVDAEKLAYLLAKGYIQNIESDHAPHTKEAKRQAEHTGGHCFGVPSIEHIVPLMLYQVKRGMLTYERLVDAMSTQPALLFGLARRSDTQTTWSLEEGRIETEKSIMSSAGWTPYLGMNTLGRLVESRISGRIIYRNGGIFEYAHRPISQRGAEI